ncbi:hypothetical protein D3C71_1882320 [compost metagenome]
MLYASKETCLPSTKTFDTEALAVAVASGFAAGSELGSTGLVVGSTGFEVDADAPSETR